MKINYFMAKNLDELKQEYRKLVFLHHPDKGGSTAAMQEVNAEYDYLNELLAKQAYSEDFAEYEKAVNIGQEMAEKLQAIIYMSDIEIEICGVWLWVTGNTKPYKEVFKDKKLGFKWSGKKSAWYWHSETEGFTRSRGNYTLEEIRTKYGSQKVRNQENKKLTAR